MKHELNRLIIGIEIRTGLTFYSGKPDPDNLKMPRLFVDNAPDDWIELPLIAIHGEKSLSSCRRSLSRLSVLFAP